MSPTWLEAVKKLWVQFLYVIASCFDLTTCSHVMGSYIIKKDNFAKPPFRALFSRAGARQFEKSKSNTNNRSTIGTWACMLAELLWATAKYIWISIYNQSIQGNFAISFNVISSIHPSIFVSPRPEQIIRVEKWFRLKDKCRSWSSFAIWRLVQSH